MGDYHIVWNIIRSILGGRGIDMIKRQRMSDKENPNPGTASRVVALFDGRGVTSCKIARSGTTLYLNSRIGGGTEFWVTSGRLALNLLFGGAFWRTWMESTSETTPRGVYLVFGRTIDLRFLKEPSIIYVCVFLSLMSNLPATTLTSDDLGKIKFACTHLFVVVVVALWYSTRAITGSGIRYLSACLVMVLWQIVSVYWKNLWYVDDPLSYLGGSLIGIELALERMRALSAPPEDPVNHDEEPVPPSR